MTKNHHSIASFMQFQIIQFAFALPSDTIMLHFIDQLRRFWRPEFT
jgi:hypothetical protein